MVGPVIPTGGAATLVVAWRPAKRVHGRCVQFGGDLSTELRQCAVRTAEIIAENDGKSYDPDDEQNDAPYLTVDPDELQDTEVLGVLKEGASLPMADAEELHNKTLVFYALLLGNGVDDRSIFVKKGNPIKLGDKGILALLDRSLHRVTAPIFAFSPDFDVVITPTGIWTLKQDSFEKLFKETDVVLAKTGEWVDQLATRLPIEEDNRDRVMPNGKLALTSETQKDVLALLNDDLFTGDFSGEQYAAGRKARRV